MAAGAALVAPALENFMIPGLWKDLAPYREVLSHRAPKSGTLSTQCKELIYEAEYNQTFYFPGHAVCAGDFIFCHQ